MSYPPGSESSSTPSEPTGYPPPSAPTYPPASNYPLEPPASPAPQAPPPAYPIPPTYAAAPTAQLPPVPPQPMPPTYDPAAVAAQYSGPPVSGPYGYPVMPVPPPRKGRAVTVVLSILTAVFVLASGGLGALFVMKNREATNLSNEVTELNSTVQSTEQELETTKRNLRDSDDELEEATTQKNAMADCLNGIYDYWDALDASGGADTPATDAAAQEADRLCDIADNYLAPR